LLKKVYKFIVKGLVVLSLGLLALGGIFASVNIEIGYDVVYLGLWILLLTPLIPVTAVLIDSYRIKDTALVLISLLVIGIILVNMVYYGFGLSISLSIPFPLSPLPPL